MLADSAFDDSISRRCILDNISEEGLNGAAVMDCLETFFVVSDYDDVNQEPRHPRGVILVWTRGAENRDLQLGVASDGGILMKLRRAFLDPESDTFLLVSVAALPEYSS